MRVHLPDHYLGLLSEADVLLQLACSESSSHPCPPPFASTLCRGVRQVPTSKRKEASITCKKSFRNIGDAEGLDDAAAIFLPMSK